MIIGVDFDGTCVTNKFPSCGKNIGAGPVLRLFQSKGLQLMLWTMRGNNRKDWLGREYDNSLLSDALLWSSKENIKWSGINSSPANQDWTDSNKQFADLYIDDMALGCPLKHYKGSPPFVDWKEVLMKVNKLIPGTFSPEELSETFVYIERELRLL